MKNFLLLFLGLFLLCFISTSAYATPVNFEINAGWWASETSWSVEQQTNGTFSEEMLVDTMTNNEVYTYNWDLSDGIYLLHIQDRWGDGLDGNPPGSVFLELDGVVLLDHTGELFQYDYFMEFEVAAATAPFAAATAPFAAATAPVPEPATMLLFGLGLLGLAGVSRKKK